MFIGLFGCGVDYLLFTCLLLMSLVVALVGLLFAFGVQLLGLLRLVLMLCGLLCFCS